MDLIPTGLRMTEESQPHGDPNRPPTDPPQQPLALLTSSEFPFVMPIPTSSDDLEATATKLQGLASALSSGRGLALTTGSRASPHSHEIEAFAKERMVDPESAQYEQWKAGQLDLPQLDLATHRTVVQPEALSTFTQRAEAINVIYKCRGVDPENAAWVSTNIPTLMPLVKAVGKILSAKTHLETHGPLFKLSEAEVAEIQTLKVIAAAAEENVAREKERVRGLLESINQSQEVIRARLKALGK